VDDSLNFVLLAARLALGVMIFLHGVNHLLRTIRGQGVAEWFESLGVRPGKVHAWSVTITELAVAEMLITGLLTPLAYAGLGALMIVAWLTAHRTNGFFIFNAGQGWEYVGVVTVLSIVLGTLSPGEWSLDHALDLEFPFNPGDSLIITAAVAILGAGAFLVLFWRPPATSSSTTKAKSD
jgi:putative oxidoreductase